MTPAALLLIEKMRDETDTVDGIEQVWASWGDWTDSLYKQVFDGSAWVSTDGV